MIDVKDADLKFDAMLFKVEFQGRLNEMAKGINIVKKACDEVRTSERLHKMLGMILTVVNQINTGGEDGNPALAFNLDSLMKLGEAKAFDKKTSVLEYLAKIIRQNDKDLLDLKDDLETVPASEGVILDGLANDIKDLDGELEKVAETAMKEADALEKEGKLKTKQKPKDEQPVDENQLNSEDQPFDESQLENEHQILDENQLENQDQLYDENRSCNEDSAGKKGQGLNENQIDEETGFGYKNQRKDKSQPQGEYLKEKNTNDFDKSEDAEGSEQSKKPRTSMENFMMKARQVVNDILKQLESLQESYISLLKYFSEDEKMSSNDFFGIFHSFIIQFKIASEKVEKIEKLKEKERIKAEKKVAAEAKKARRAFKKIAAKAAVVAKEKREKKFVEDARKAMKEIAVMTAVAAEKAIQAGKEARKILKEISATTATAAEAAMKVAVKARKIRKEIAMTAAAAAKVKIEEKIAEAARKVMKENAFTAAIVARGKIKAVMEREIAILLDNLLE